MELDDIKIAIKNLKPEERRKVALYILELEKNHLQEKLGPQIAEDLEGVSKVVRDIFERVKEHINPP